MSRRQIVRPAKGVVRTMHENGDTQDIINTVLWADKGADKYIVPDAARRALLVAGDDYATLRNVWEYVRQNVRYRADTRGHEVVKSPGALFQVGVGDCKSFSVAVAAILRALGYPNVYYRFTGYRSQGDYTHVYVVVKFSDATIAVDSTYQYFNNEVAPAIQKDYPATGSGDSSVQSPHVSGDIQDGLRVAGFVALAVLTYYLIAK